MEGLLTRWECLGAPSTELVLREGHPLPLGVQPAIPASEPWVVTKGDQGQKLELRLQAAYSKLADQSKREFTGR